MSSRLPLFLVSLALVLVALAILIDEEPVRATQFTDPLNADEVFSLTNMSGTFDLCCDPTWPVLNPCLDCGDPPAESPQSDFVQTNGLYTGSQPSVTAKYFITDITATYLDVGSNLATTKNVVIYIGGKEIVCLSLTPQKKTVTVSNTTGWSGTAAEAIEYFVDSVDTRDSLVITINGFDFTPTTGP